MKKNILKIIFAVWIVLWVFFLVREDKDGQYRDLRYMYTHGYEDKSSYVMGDELYDFLVFCRKNMPEGATYELSGFENLSIGEVRARYFLWPFRRVEKDPDFIIVCGKKGAKVPGYSRRAQYDGPGCLLVKEAADE